MNLALVCYPSVGGSGVIASELALGLAERGHRIQVVSYAVPFRLQRFHPSISVHVVEVPSYPLFKYPPYTLSLATKLADVAAENSVELIHAHYAVPHAISAWLARQILGGNSPKVVTTLHGTDITLVGADPSFRRVVRFALEGSDGVTAVSQYLRRRTVEEFETGRSLAVIYNFVDTRHYERAGNRGARQGEEKVLVHASNFRAVKRVPDVVRVFAGVRARMEAKLLFVGDGPERAAVQAQVEETGLRDDVRFLGEVDRLDGVLRDADLFLLPSEEESFGLVALEAMSSRVPVVATRVGGLPEVVADGESGYLLPVGAVEAMAEAAVDLLRDEAKRQRFGARGREIACQRFDASRIIPEYERFYRAVLGS